MSALGGVVRSGVRRRRVQTVVIAMVVMIAVAAAVLGGSVLVASNAPFDRAFTQQHGSHLTAQFDASKTTAEQLAASARATGVTAAAGPFPTASISPVDEGGRPIGQVNVAGRAGPGGGVDRVTLLSGAWATEPGQLVLAIDLQGDVRFRSPLGEKLTLPDLPGKPTLTIVGTARSVSETAGGWVSPDQATALVAPGASGGWQMLYRFAAADTRAQIATDRAAVTAGTASALTAATSWLAVKQQNTQRSALFVPFLIAFGVLGLVMAVLIVGNVIAGAVGAGTHRIGILKALGCTPSQVIRAYLGQALIPAAVGAALGAAGGNLLIAPLLSQSNRLYGTNDSGVAPWVDVVVIGGALGVVTVSAGAAALRAGRLRTVDALTVGRTPRPHRGQRAARVSGLLPLPRPATLGLAHPFARPLRAATMVAAIAFGATAVTLSVGLAASLNEIHSATGETADVVAATGLRVSGPPPPGANEPAAPVTETDKATGQQPTAADPAVVGKAITALAGTSGYSGSASAEVTVAGLAKATEVLALTGTDTSNGYRMVSGRWFTRPGEIVVATPFLTATDTRVGDTVVLTDRGNAVKVHIVGEAFNTEGDGTQVLTAAATLAAAEPDLRATDYSITVTAGTDPANYAEKLDDALSPLGMHAFVPENDTAELILIIDTLAGFLTLMLVIVAGLGVLNSVVLETRERVHDIGVHKALGMSPRQTITMVIASVVVIGLAGGAAGVPIGLVVHGDVVRSMAHTAGYNLPASIVNVFRPGELVVFGLGGLLIAVLGALLPAGWAARTRTATALRTE